jgi:hypothetical protein
VPALDDAHHVGHPRLGMDADTHLAGQRDQLIDGRRAVYVGRDQEGRLLLRLEPLGELARGGRLARSLQPYQQHHRRRHGGVGDRGLLFTQQGHQLVIDDLDQLLARPDRLERHDSDRLLLHPLEELAGQLEAHVGLEQDAPDLPEPLADGVLGEDPALGQLLERSGEFAGKVFKHKPRRLNGIRGESKANGGSSERERRE